MASPTMDSETMDSASIQALFADVVSAVAGALDAYDGAWDGSGQREDQYKHDVVADEAALKVLFDAPVTVLSEETGEHNPGADVTIVVDPVDGSTNASIGLPWYAVSLAAVRNGELIESRVDNLATGDTFLASAGRGATMNGAPIAVSGQTDVDAAIIGVNGRPAEHLGTRQFRTLGATALDMSFVAAGRLDGYVDATVDRIAPWDYLGALLICREAGAACADVFGRDLVTTRFTDRRTPVAAATEPLLAELLRRRGSG